MEEAWIHTDEVEDVAGSIRHALHTVQFAGDDKLAWKWVVLALHSALQGACVCHLTTTAVPLGAVTERNAAKWLAYFEESRVNANSTPPKTYLMPLPDLLKAVRTAHSAGDSSNANGVTISDSELSWLRRFNDDIRNQFVHFAPMGWSIEISGISKLAELIARIVKEILEIGWAFRHLDVVQREHMKRDLEELSRLPPPA